MRYEIEEKLTITEISSIYEEAWASLGDEIQDAVASCGCGGCCLSCARAAGAADSEAERLARELLGLPA